MDPTLRRLRIASVLNLRGGSPSDWWYASEVDSTRRLGVDFYDLPMSADRRPSRRELLLLLDLFDRCRYPIWIHCKSGSDRTGLAAALYAMTIEGRPPDAAHGAFSIWRGHIAAFGPQRLHEPIHEYATWLRQSARPHTPELFRAWVELRYQADDPPPAAAPRLRPGPRDSLATGVTTSRG